MGLFSARKETKQLLLFFQPRLYLAHQRIDPKRARPFPLCLARDRLHRIPETWFTQLAFGESQDAVENV